MKARWACLTLGFGLLAASCTAKSPSGLQSQSPRPTGPAGPQTFTVSVDGSTASFSLAADAYFPNQLQVHAGDTIAFKEVSSGEPHTVTFGTLVDQAAGPQPSPTARSSPTAATLPSIFPATATGPTRGDAVPAAAQPCFLDTGSPPPAAACTTSQPPFSGNQPFYNSGWLAPGQVFKVPISTTVNPGTYNFRCLVHPAMRGQVQVVAPATQIPSPAQVTDAGTTQLGQLVTSLMPAAQNAAQVTATNVAGVTQVGVSGGFVAAFGPASVSVKRFQTLSWTLYGQHALAFNPPSGAQGILTRLPDGTVHINATVAGHVGGQAPPTPAPTKPTTVSGGSYSGSGFHNSGLLTSYPPGLLTYTLSFTSAGTYTLQCLIHPAMTTTITVS